MAKKRKNYSDAQRLLLVLAENGMPPRDELEPATDYELMRFVFAQGQILVLYVSGSAVVQGSGSRSDIAAVCRADGWGCKS